MDKLIPQGIMFTVVVLMFSIALALAQLAQPGRKLANSILAGLMFCFCLWWVHTLLVFLNVPDEIPDLKFVHLPFAYFCGPLVYLYYRAIITPGYRFGNRHLVHLAIPSVAVLLLTPLYQADDAYKLCIDGMGEKGLGCFAQNILWDTFCEFGPDSLKRPPTPLEYGLALLLMGPKISVLTYLLGLLGTVRKKWNSSGMAWQMYRRPILLLIVIPICTTSIAVAGHFVTGTKLIGLGTVLLSVWVLVTFVLGQRYQGILFFDDPPGNASSENLETSSGSEAFAEVLNGEPDSSQKGQSSTLIRSAGNGKHPPSSALRSMSPEKLDALGRDLRAKMANEKVYRAQHLGLENLSDSLNTTPHVLSAYMNRVLNASFNDFVNEYRVVEAKCLLVETDRKVIDIQESVGFFAKNTFISAFKKFTGLTPRQYREKYKN